MSEREFSRDTLEKFAQSVNLHLARVPDLAKFALRLLDEREKDRDALRKVATYEQGHRPLPDDGWGAPYDWRRRSMKQEHTARARVAAWDAR